MGICFFSIEHEMSDQNWPVSPYWRLQKSRTSCLYF